MNDPITLCDEMEFDGPLDGGTDVREDFIFNPPIDDPSYLKLMAKYSVPPYESNELNKLIGTLMILNTCATNRIM
jgi:hypothetical protein